MEEHLIPDFERCKFFGSTKVYSQCPALAFHWLLFAVAFDLFSTKTCSAQQDFNSIAMTDSIL
jgi:hypothetical protein